MNQQPEKPIGLYNLKYFIEDVFVDSQSFEVVPKEKESPSQKAGPTSK